MRIRPPSSISGNSFWVRKTGPRRCVATSEANCSSVASTKFANRPLPALLTRKSKRSRANSVFKVSVTALEKAG
ncbi:Ribosomal protein L20 [Pseudomonas syringae pv. actinidiae]|uniref:Ribosomal protein L20 n=1 Tax=Pseudomonas syringae pv. actinidiae TaxID=103796 RepID=A0A2V0QBG8_PSESF|nr:Ribosomal protein L20 [Pseudomonas syringae pv. actinidiae]